MGRRGVVISMGRKENYNDNLPPIDLLWRTVKYEEVHLKAYKDGRDARIAFSNYFCFYNVQRPHLTLGYRTSAKAFTPSPTYPKQCTAGEKPLQQTYVDLNLIRV